MELGALRLRLLERARAREPLTSHLFIYLFIYLLLIADVGRERGISVPPPSLRPHLFAKIFGKMQL
jgi:hypothetical protein